MCRIFWRFVFCLAIGIVGSGGLSLADQPHQAYIQEAHQKISALDTVCFFDWLETHFPEHLYPPAPAQSTADGWTYRHYVGAEAWLAVYTGLDAAYRNQVFYLGPLSGYSVANLGSTDVWEDASGCRLTAAGERLQPADLVYQGAFRLPATFNWGALGLSYYPAGDAGAGSLLVTGFEAISSPEHPFESCWNSEWDCYAWYGQVSIPTPAVEEDWENLPQATLLGSMVNFDQGLISDVHREYVFVSDIEFVPKTGSQTQDKLYGAADFWYPEGIFGGNSFPTIWMADINGANARGMFHAGPNVTPFHGRKTGAYLFSAPQWYANQYLGGRTLITGRSRGTPADYEPITTHGGSQGPTLFAFHPFDSDTPSGNLNALPFLYYRVKFPGCAGPNIGPTAECDYPAFTMCDHWTGGAFVDDGRRQAIMLLGYKGLGRNCYGGAACGDPCNDYQGYHCHPYERQVIFYDIHELGAVARTERDPWSVLPYAIWRPDEFYLQGDTCWNAGGMTFDPASGRVFMVERGLGGETNAAVMHVWRVQGVSPARQSLGVSKTGGGAGTVVSQPDGTLVTEFHGDCPWCANWCAAHPGDCLNLPATDDQCAHSHGLNYKIKGIGLWHLAARVAGWPSGRAAGLAGILSLLLDDSTYPTNPDHLR